MKLPICFLFIFLLLETSCSLVAEEPVAPAPEVISSSKILYLSKGQLKELTASNNFPENEEIEFRWTSDGGTILENRGKSVLFQAPENTGSYSVSCQQLHKEQLLGSIHFEVKIFQQVVVLKADDLVYEENTIFPQNWNRYFDLVESMGIKGSAGIIGNSLENAPQQYYDRIKQIHKEGKIEFWNHGYTHQLGGINEQGEKFHEFFNTDQNFQRSHLLRTQELGKEKLGITFHAFGAPGNAIDAVTKEVLEENSDIKIWFFGNPDSEKSILKRTPGCEIEFPVHHPSLSKFLEGYQPDVPFLCLQLHPTRWSSQEFQDFSKILEFLKNQQVYFLTPTEFARQFHSDLFAEQDNPDFLF